MPIVRFFSVEGTLSPEQRSELVLEASRVYAGLLAAPVERIRAFVAEIPAGGAALGGELVTKDGPPVPFFEALVLAGRPVEQRHAIISAFTDLIVEKTGMEKAKVRGRCIPVDPDDWCIGGTPASVLRKGEIAARAGSDAKS